MFSSQAHTIPVLQFLQGGIGTREKAYLSFLILFNEILHTQIRRPAKTKIDLKRIEFFFFVEIYE